MKIVAYYPRNMLERYIASWSGRFCHVAFLVKTSRFNSWVKRLGYEELKTDDAYIQVEARLLSGVSARPFTEASTGKKFNIVDIDVPNIYEEMILLFLISNLTKKYSLRQILGIFCRFAWNTNLRVFMTPGFICTELVARALRIAYPDMFETNLLDFMLPDELLTYIGNFLKARE